MTPRTSVDVLIVRNVECDSDARIQKLLNLYSRLDLDVAIVCASRTRSCIRQSTPRCHHTTVALGSWSAWHDRELGLFRRATSFLREVLKLSAASRSTFAPQIVHGCDLDGFLACLGAYPLAKRRSRIFDVFDPWSTMVQAPGIATVERLAVRWANVIVSPAQDPRIAFPHHRTIVLQNSVDLTALSSLAEDRSSPMHVRPYVLLGGTLDLRVLDTLAKCALRAPGLDVLVCDERPLERSEFPENMVFIGRVTWSRWLSLLSGASATWCWYDMNVSHYESHISPNKYWEAALYGVPLIVNSVSQFCDRVPCEPPLLEIGPLERHDILCGLLEELSSQGPVAPRPLANIGFWSQLEAERVKALHRAVSWCLAPTHEALPRC